MQRKVAEPKRTKPNRVAPNPSAKSPALNRHVGMTVGYVRVSTDDQNTARQLEGIDTDRTFTDRASGKNMNRPQLEALLSFAREGDTVVCHSMDRLGRNLDDLRRLVLDMTGRGIQVRFVKESLVFTGDDSPMANLLLSVMGAFAQFERELIRERQREGIAAAKKKGIYKGRKPSLDSAQITELRRRAAERCSRTALAKEFGISRNPLYEYITLPSTPTEGPHR